MHALEDHLCLSAERQGSGTRFSLTLLVARVR
jgi:hypothetical protein